MPWSYINVNWFLDEQLGELSAYDIAAEDPFDNDWCTGRWRAVAEAAMQKRFVGGGESGFSLPIWALFGIEDEADIPNFLGAVRQAALHRGLFDGNPRRDQFGHHYEEGPEEVRHPKD